MSTAHPTVAVHLLVLPVVPWGSCTTSVPIRASPVRAGHVSIVGPVTPPAHATAAAVVASAPTDGRAVLVLLIPLGQVGLAVAILPASVGRALVVRLVVLLWKGTREMALVP